MNIVKVCCSSGKVYQLLTEAERIGGCSTDHCIGPIELADYLKLLEDREEKTKVTEENT